MKRSSRSGWREMLVAARERANLRVERVPLWRVAEWGLKLIGLKGVVPFPDLVSRGLYVEDSALMGRVLQARVFVEDEAQPGEQPTVDELIRNGQIHPVEVESVARVAGGFFVLMGALVSRIAQGVAGGREAHFGWGQVFIQTLPDDEAQPGCIGLVVDLSGEKPLVLVEARFEATADHAEAGVVLSASYATSWSNLHGEHGLAPDHMVRRLSQLPTLFSAPGHGDGGRERKTNSLTLREWDGSVEELPEDRYAWMALEDLIDAQGDGLTTPHLDAMLGRLLAYLSATGWVRRPE